MSSNLESCWALGLGAIGANVSLSLCPTPSLFHRLYCVCKCVCLSVWLYYLMLEYVGFWVGWSGVRINALSLMSDTKYVLYNTLNRCCWSARSDSGEMGAGRWGGRGGGLVWKMCV